MIKEYLATFHTNFGAQSFYKFAANGMTKATMRPIPRELSSSCGTCVLFSTDSPIDSFDSNKYDMERLYEESDGSHDLLIEYE